MRNRFGPREAAWAIVLGALSATAASLLRLLFVGLQWVFTHHGGTLPQAAASLKPWWRLVVPVLGALMATLVLVLRRRGEPKPVPFVEYVSAVRREGGHISLVPNLWRSASSAFSVATGAAIGREGSMIQFAAAITAAVARFVHKHLPQAEEFPAPLGVACGVAGGVATAYQAPVAAIFFAAEIALGRLLPRELLAIGCASAAGWLVSRSILQPGPLYPAHPAMLWSLHSAGAMVLLAVAIGAAGPLYQRLIRSMTFLRKVRVPLLWGGIATGALSLLDPRVWGNGDAGLDAALGRGHGPAAAFAFKALLVLLVLRLLATTICVGVGTVGGVFTPTLFAGGVLGFTAGKLLHTGDPALLGMLGMGCLIAAATHAPLMAAFMAVELTGDWRLLPLMLAGCIMSWLVARRISPEALYAIATNEPVHEGLTPASAKVMPEVRGSR